jgi:hypothetical protein
MTRRKRDSKGRFVKLRHHAVKRERKSRRRRRR